MLLLKEVKLLVIRISSLLGLRLWLSALNLILLFVILGPILVLLAVNNRFALALAAFYGLPTLVLPTLVLPLLLGDPSLLLLEVHAYVLPTQILHLLRWLLLANICGWNWGFLLALVRELLARLRHVHLLRRV